MLTKHILVIVLQHIQISYHDVVHLKLIQCYMSITSQYNQAKRGISNEQKEEYLAKGIEISSDPMIHLQYS